VLSGRDASATLEAAIVHRIAGFPQPTANRTAYSRDLSQRRFLTDAAALLTLRGAAIHDGISLRLAREREVWRSKSAAED